MYGYYGLLGLLASASLLAFYGVAMLRLGERFQARNHRDVFLAIGGRWLGPLMDWVITGFLFAGTGVMIAGSGAIFREQFGLPELLGNLVMAGAAAVTVALGFRGVVRAISMVTPLLIVTVTVIAWFSLPPVDQWPGLLLETTDQWGIDLPATASPHWLLSGALYASYNLLLATAILAPLGAEVPGARMHWLGGSLGGLGLGFTALVIHAAMIAHINEVVALDVPTLYLARSISPVLTIVYTVVLWAEVYTTAVSGLYGFTARLVRRESPAFGLAAALFAVAAFLIGRVGFAELVLTLYPAVGYLGLVFFGVILWYLLQNPRWLIRS